MRVTRDISISCKEKSDCDGYRMNDETAHSWRCTN
jgi:hypothetical protein